MAVLAWPHQRQPLEIMKEYSDNRNELWERTGHKHKASYMNTTAMGECYITKNKRGMYVKDKVKGKMRIVRNKTTWQNKEK